MLIAPLDWGLGHATRCIPLIRACLEKKCNVLLAGSGNSLKLLREEFPSLPAVEIPGYEIRYQKQGSFILKLSFQLGKIFSGMRRERKALKHICKHYPVALILSDNRYGFRAKQIPSVLISHQMMVKIPDHPMLEGMVHKWLRGRCRRFDAVWIPDTGEAPGLSGDLSHKYPKLPNTLFIGILTRFAKPVKMPGTEYDMLVILSGPEPQRGMLEKAVIAQANKMQLRFAIVEGIAGKYAETHPAPHITVFSHLRADALYDLILRSSVILSRGGYSTLMDLAMLGKQCIFIPTPGQTEQEYIVQALAEKNLVVMQAQDHINLEEAWKKIRVQPPFLLDADPFAFRKTLFAQLASAGLLPPEKDPQPAGSPAYAGDM